VTVTNKTAKNATLEIDYVVSNAGWYPVYDLRAKDSKSPVQLNYKAQVYQNTGIDWSNVKLKLSTSNPSLGGTKPVLSSWFLNFYEPRPVSVPMYRSNKEMKKSAAPSMADDNAYEVAGMEESESIADYTKVVQTTLAAEFDIAVPYTIPSDGVGLEVFFFRKSCIKVSS
ncbi:MAG: mucoidy inhibitor MuiA family protein, partial [Hymenobacter sp.]